MSLSDLASIGTLISGFAVLASLIYLSLQVRQATKHQQAQMLESRTARVFELQTRIAEPDTAVIWDKGSTGQGSFTTVDYRQY